MVRPTSGLFSRAATNCLCNITSWKAAGRFLSAGSVLANVRSIRPRFLIRYSPFEISYFPVGAFAFTSSNQLNTNRKWAWSFFSTASSGLSQTNRSPSGAMS